MAGVRGPGGMLIGGQTPEDEPWWKTLLWTGAWMLVLGIFILAVGTVLDLLGLIK